MRPGQVPQIITLGCYSTAIGNSATQPNPVTVNVNGLAICQENLRRKEIIVVNSGTTNIFISLGFPASPTAYSVFLASGGNWISNIWQGVIFACSDVNGGAVCVTEEI